MKADPLGKRLALVIIDVQRKFRIDTEDAVRTHDEHVGNINALSRMFRDAGRPVIFVKYIGGDECRPYEGTDGDEFFPGIETADSDVVVEKHHMNSFRESDLAGAVRSAGCDGVLLAGTVTQYCVLSTYYAAFDDDLSPFLAGGACMSTSEETNRAVEHICKTLGPDDVRRYLAGEPMPDAEFRLSS